MRLSTSTTSIFSSNLLSTKIILLFIQFLDISFAKSDSTFKLEPVARWSRLEYDINSGYLQNHYNHEHNILGNVRHYDSLLYVAVPRWRDGVPSTLNTFSVTMSKKAQRNEKRMSPKLKPFPNLASNIVGDCKAMQNVAALEIDPRGWLWVADSGTAAIFSSPNRRCRAKLIIYDLNSHTQLLHYNFPRAVVGGNGVLMHMALDFSGTGGVSINAGRQEHLDHAATVLDAKLAKAGQVYAYFADITQGAIVVFDFATRTSWKKEAKSMRPVSLPLNFAGEEIHVRHGVTGIALESNVQDHPRRLFFGTLTSDLYALETWTLKNSSLEIEDVTDFVQELGDRKDSCEAMTSDGRGFLYYGLLTQGSLMSWNTSDERPSSAGEVVIQNPEKLMWINSIFISEGSIWIATNRFHAFTWSSMTFTGSESNFQIFKLPTHTGLHNYMQEFVNCANSNLLQTISTIALALCMQIIIYREWNNL